MTTTTTLDPTGDTRALGPSDSDLLDRVRAGDAASYGLLYERHEPAARSLARYLTKSNHDADDVVADAFARVLRAIKGGAGPTEAFRPYLLTAVRRTVWRKTEDARHYRLAADDDEEEMLYIRLAVEPEDRTEETIILRAFGELPERWQLVLWHTEIEGQPPAAVAPLLGLSPNATAALAVRAREGLRQAYLQAHLQSRPADTCRFTVEHLGAYVRDGLGQRDTAKVEEHLRDCDSCGGLQSDLGSLNKVLRSVVGPAVLGTGAQDIAHRVRFPQALGLAGAAALLLVTLGVNSDVARSPNDATTVAALLDEPGPSAAPQLVGSALLGTAGGSPSVSTAACGGASLPLSLPAGSTPAGAALVTGAPSGAPTVVEPQDAGGLETVGAEDDAALVGSNGACVTSLITPLVEAPDDTALAVSFFDRLGVLRILVVPQIVTVVQDALQRATDLAVFSQLGPYLDALGDAVGQLPGADGGDTSGGPTDADPGVPGLPPVDVPDLPGLPPAPGGDGGGGALDDVGDIVDDVTAALPALP